MTGRPVAIVTAGGTREAIDEVRYIANAATGALPQAIAEELLGRGWAVHYLHGPGALVAGRVRADLDAMASDGRDLAVIADQIAEKRERCSRGELHLWPVNSAAQAGQTLRSLAADRHPQAAVCAMAVADFSPDAVTGKLQSRADSLGAGNADSPAVPLTLTLRPTAKTIDVVKAASPRTWLLGFKLLAGADEPTLIRAAAHLATRSGADAVFANDIRDVAAAGRKGLIVDQAATVLMRLDCGTGPAATRQLAAVLARYVAERAGF